MPDCSANLAGPHELNVLRNLPADGLGERRVANLRLVPDAIDELIDEPPALACSEKYLGLTAERLQCLLTDFACRSNRPCDQINCLWSFLFNDISNLGCRDGTSTNRRRGASTDSERSGCQTICNTAGNSADENAAEDVCASFPRVVDNPIGRAGGESLAVCGAAGAVRWANGRSGSSDPLPARPPRVGEMGFCGSRQSSLIGPPWHPRGTRSCSAGGCMSAELSTAFALPSTALIKS
jgi:hypothetical protein